MSADLFNHGAAVGQIEGICSRLFDAWCETRNITFLTFLLHCWPLISVEPAALRQLSNTLGELRKSHGGALNEEQTNLLVELEQHVKDLQVHAPEHYAVDRQGRDRAWVTSKLLRLCRIEP